MNLWVQGSSLIKNGLDRMENNGVTLINFEMMFFELIRDAKTQVLKNFI